jgi:hypothetical protein
MKKFEVSEEQMKQLFPTMFSEAPKVSKKFNSELTAIKNKLEAALEAVNNLLNDKEVSKKVKEPLTDDLLIQLWKDIKNKSQIAKETGWGYPTVTKKIDALLTSGKIKEHIKAKK